MVKLNICAARRPGMTRAQYLRYAADDHGRLVLGTEPVSRHLTAYVQQHVYDGCYGAAAPPWRFDSVSHISAESPAALAAATATDEYRTLIAPDEARFADQRSPLFLLLAEAALPLPQRGISSRRLLHYLRARDGMAPAELIRLWRSAYEALLERSPELFAGLRRASLGLALPGPDGAPPAYAGMCELGFLQASDEVAITEIVRGIERDLGHAIEPDASFYLLAEAVPLRGHLT